MGSGAGAVGEAVDDAGQPGREGRAAGRAALPAVPRRGADRRPPADACARWPSSTAPRSPGAPADPLHLDVMAALHDPRAAARFAAGTPRTIGVRYGLSSKEFTPAMAAAVFTEAAAKTPDAPVRGGHRRRRDEQLPRGPDGLPGRHLPRPGGLLRPRIRRHGGRQQEHRHHRRRRHRPQRAGLLRLRLEEVRLGHREPPALRRGADHQHLPDQRGDVRRRPPVGPDGEAQRARGGRSRGTGPAQLARIPPTRSGTTCPTRSSSRSWPRTSTCGPSTPPPWPARPGSAGASTPSCRRASSRSPACCPSRRRCRG